MRSQTKCLLPAVLALAAAPVFAWQAPPAAPAAAPPAAPGAATPRPDRYGEITGIAGDAYTLTSRRSGVVTVTIPASMPVEGRQGAPASHADLKVGTRIGVYGTAGADGAFTASRVVLLPARPAGVPPARPAAAPATPHPVIVYPAIAVDTSGAPDLAAFAAHTKAICEAAYPQIIEYLHSSGFEAPRQFRQVYEEMDGVAYTSGDACHFAAAYFRAHPEDYGAAVHEMIHVIQHYDHGDNPGWLVEALDDYVRFYRYEPVYRLPHASPDRVGDKPEAYQTGAQFLDWAQTKYDASLVPELNAAMRQGQYTDTLWKDKTGHTLTDLWAEWKVSLRMPGNLPTARTASPTPS